MGDKSYIKEVQGTFKKYNMLCGEAKENLVTLIGLIPEEEAEKQDVV